jgi:hypothetical protein
MMPKKDGRKSFNVDLLSRLTRKEKSNETTQTSTDSLDSHGS